MPPRHAYWTILIGEAPTAFRSRDRDDLVPTLEQLRVRQPDAVLKWFERGRLWASPDEARETSRPPKERRGREWRPGGAHRDPRDRFKGRPEKKPGDARREGRGPDAAGPGPDARRPWSPKSDRPQGERPWKPKGDRPPGDRPRKPKGDRPPGDRPWKPKGDRPPGDRPWKPKSDRPQGDRPWKPKSDRPTSDRPWKPKADRPSGDRPWKPKSDRPPGGDRPWKPKDDGRGEPTREERGRRSGTRLVKKVRR